MTDYEGVTHAGIAVVAADTGRVLLAQRSFDETDDEAVRETWEFPGGSLEPDEDPLTGAMREFTEEVGVELPAGEVIDGWRGGDNPETGHYQGFVYQIPTQMDLSRWVPTEEVQLVAWMGPEQVAQREAEGQMRPEIAATMDWGLIFPANAEESTMDEPDFDEMVASLEPIPIHGVLAPEDTRSGDGRGFNAGALTARPLRLPFAWQKKALPAHEGAVTVASIDRMMRKDGLIHWEGSMLANTEAEEFTELLAHFGRYGVSIDGDSGALDIERSTAEGMTWFEACRIAGATGCAIPAFAEAYAALGFHPDMPTDESLVASLHQSGDLIGASTFKRGAGWVTNPKETKTLHDYWTKKGEEGYAKVGWGTPGDFRRAKALIGAKIAKNSPDKMRYLNQIIAQWHYDALGYWPGDLDKPGNKTTAEAKAERASTELAFSELDVEQALKDLTNDDIDVSSEGWEAVLVSSVSGNPRPALSHFHRHESGDALVIEDPDEFGFKRTYGYAAYWGVCHVGMDGRCVEPPRTYSDDYPEFHLGRTRTDEGYITTGVLTYGVGHRDAKTILSESPDQAYFDNINNAWAAVRVGEDEIGIWFSGVVLPGVPENHLTKIEASGQVSGEWKRGAMRACLTVNVPGFPVERPSVEYDEQGNVMALAASAFGGVSDSPCEPTAAERMSALKAAHEQAEAEARWLELRASFTDQAV